MKNKLTTREAISIICIISLCQLILNTPKIIINTCNTGSIINILYISLIALFVCIIISKLIKNFPSDDIIDISEKVGGNILKFIISIIFIIFFLLLILIALADFSYLLKCIYFQNAPLTFILLFFIIAALFANLTGFNSIQKTSTILLPIIIYSFLIIFLKSIPDMNLDDFTPILGYSYKSTFQTGLLNLFFFDFLILYLFIMPLLKRKNDIKKIIFTSFGINIISLIISILSLIAVFTAHINSSNINSLYFLTRSIKLSTFIEQVDAIYIFIWILSLFAYISILLFLITHILNKLFHFKDYKQTSYSILSILIGLSLIFTDLSEINFLEETLFKYFSIIITFGISLLILILGNLKQKRHFNKKEQLYEK